MFRTDKPLPPLPKGITDAFSSIMAPKGSGGPPPKLPDKKPTAPSTADRSRAAAADMAAFGSTAFAQAKQLFEKEMGKSRWVVMILIDIL